MQNEYVSRLRDGLRGLYKSRNFWGYVCAIAVCAVIAIAFSILMLLKVTSLSNMIYSKAQPTVMKRSSGMSRLANVLAGPIRYSPECLRFRSLHLIQAIASSVGSIQ